MIIIIIIIIILIIDVSLHYFCSNFSKSHWILDNEDKKIKITIIITTINNNKTFALRHRVGRYRCTDVTTGRQ